MRGIVNNSNERQAAYEACAARLDALIQWHRSIGEVLPPVDMGANGVRNRSLF